MKQRSLVIAFWVTFLVLFTTSWSVVENILAQTLESNIKKLGPFKTPEKSEILDAIIEDIIVKYKEEEKILPGITILKDSETGILERRSVLQQRRTALGILEQALDKKSKVEVLNTFSALGAHLVKKPSGESLASTIKNLMKDPAVEYAEPDTVIFGSNHLTPPPNDGAWLNHNTFPTSTDLTSTAFVNLNQLWGLEKIGMGQAWTDIRGGNIIIAVLDSGIDYLHPDLQQNMWVNLSELNGVTGEDDDLNGYVDDIHGVNFLKHNNRTFCKRVQQPNPRDEFGHGTSVAGIIAAAGNNDPGATTLSTSHIGVNWTAQLMSLKILCEGKNGSPVPIGKRSDAMQAIQYAIDNGALVINNSWILDETVLASDIQSLRTLMSDSNAFFVTAAGNDSSNNDITPRYPSSFDLDNMITVAASTPGDEIAGFSNWGPTTVHLAAPGHNISSTYTTFMPGLLPTIINDGTSMAAPHVAGCAALLQALRISTSMPLLSPNELKVILMKSGDQPLDTTGNQILSGKVVEARRLNCHEALHFLPVCGAGCGLQPPFLNP